MHWIDPDSLATVPGKVECFVLNPHGEIDGFVIAGPKQGATLVHTPPHMAEELSRRVKVGDDVGVQGVRLRGAELLAEAIDAGLSGQQPLQQALAGYEQQRNQTALPFYELTSELARLEPPPPEMQQLLAALRENPEQARRFFGVFALTVPVPEFFAPENVQQILASRERAATAS